MSDTAPGWVVPVMRVGYFARGAVYVVIGILALLAAWHGGEAEGTTDAMQQLRNMPLGLVALWLIAAGLLAYAAWRLICAWMDLEDHGTDAKAIVARAGQAITGLIHVGLGVSAIRIALGSGGGGGDGAETWTQKLLSVPFGQWLVGIVGIIVIATGGYYAWKGWAEKYREHLRWSPTMERLMPAARLGLLAQGIVIAIIGTFLIFAALHSNASEAGGLGEAFEAVHRAAFGRALLAILAAGMLCFTVYCWIEAIWRVVPRAPGGDVETLARRAESQARSALT